MEDSPKDNKDTFQDKPEESEENPPAVESQPETLSDQETLSPSTEEETSAENRAGTPECESGTENEAFASTLSPSAAARTPDGSSIITKAQKKRTVSPESEALESPTTSPTSSYKKRKIRESSSGDSNDASIPTSADNMEHQSLYHLQTETAARNVEESEWAEDEMSTSSRGGSNDSDSLAEHSNRDNLHPNASLTNLPTEEHETDNMEHQYVHHLQTEVAARNIEESEWAEDEMSTSSRGGSNDSDSLAKHSNRDDLYPTGSLPNLATEEHETNIHPSDFSNASADGSNKDSVQQKGDSPDSDSSSVVIYSPESPVGSSEVATIPTDQDSSSKPLVQNPVVSDSLAGHSNVDDANRTKSCNNAPPEETLGEKEGTSKSGPDPPNRTSKPNVKPRTELKKSPGTRSLEIVRIPEVSEASISSNLPEIQDAKVPMQENRSDPLLTRKQSESISSELPTSRERLQVGMGEVPPNPNVHAGQPSPPIHQPVITEDHRFNSSSGVAPDRETRARAIEKNISAEMVSKIVFIAQNLLLTVLKELMKVIEENDVFKKFRSQFTRIQKCPGVKDEEDLQLDLAVYITQSKTAWKAKNVYEPPNNKNLDYQVMEAFQTLIRMVVTTLVYTVSVRSSLELNQIMDIYSTFWSLSEKCCELWTPEKIGSIQDEQTRNIVKYYIEITGRLLVQMQTPFQFLLMHVGDHADQAFLDGHIETVSELNKEYLRRRID